MHATALRKIELFLRLCCCCCCSLGLGISYFSSRVVNRYNYVSLYNCQTIKIIFLTCFNNSNQGEKGQIFQSCMSVREDPQFLVQLSSKEPAQLDTCTQLQQQTLLSPGMEIPSKQAKHLMVIFTAKYVQKTTFKTGSSLSNILKLTLMWMVQVKFEFQVNFDLTLPLQYIQNWGR